jgi:hypothetical protein
VRLSGSIGFGCQPDAEADEDDAGRAFEPVLHRLAAQPADSSRAHPHHRGKPEAGFDHEPSGHWRSRTTTSLASPPPNRRPTVATSLLPPSAERTPAPAGKQHPSSGTSPDSVETFVRRILPRAAPVLGGERGQCPAAHIVRRPGRIVIPRGRPIRRSRAASCRVGQPLQELGPLPGARPAASYVARGSAWLRPLGLR